MNLQELPVRPRPLENESIEGYFLRITARNGWQQLSPLLKFLGLPSNYVIDNLTKLKRACDSLAPRVRMSTEELFQHFRAHLDPLWIYDEKRALQGLRVRFPRLCPLCVNTTGFHWNWSLAVVSHCEQHDHPLWDSCPSCSEPFNWHSNLFIGCSKCGTNWNKTQKTALPEHQILLRQKLMSGIGLRDYIHDLCLALRASSLPYDLIHDKRGYWPTEQRYLAEKLSRAYELLTQKASIERWAHSCMYHRSELLSLGTDTVLGPIHKLRRELKGEWPLKEITIPSPLHSGALPPIGDESSTCNDWIRPARLKHAKKETDLYFQARRQDVTNLLGLPTGSTDSLIKLGLLTPMNQTQVARDQLFDLRDLTKLMIELPKMDEAPSGYIAVYNKAPILKRYGALYADVVAYALVGRIPSAVPTAVSGLSLIWVDNGAFTAFLSNICESFARNR